MLRTQDEERDGEIRDLGGEAPGVGGREEWMAKERRVGTGVSRRGSGWVWGTGRVGKGLKSERRGRGDGSGGGGDWDFWRGFHVRRGRVG
jgi:hypothetical protein